MRNGASPFQSAHAYGWSMHTTMMLQFFLLLSYGSCIAGKGSGEHDRSSDNANGSREHESSSDPEWVGREETISINVSVPMALPVETLLHRNQSEIAINFTTDVFLPLPRQLERPVLSGVLLAVAAGFALSVGVLVGCCACCGLAYMVAFDIPRGEGEEDEGFLRRKCSVLPRSLCRTSLDDGTADSNSLETRLLAEVLLGLVLQWCCFGIALLAGHFLGRVPSALVLLALPWMARNTMLDSNYRRQRERERNTYTAPLEHTADPRPRASTKCLFLTSIAQIALTKFEEMDALSDGLAVGSAFFLSEEAARRFIVSFSHGKNGVIGAFATRLGLGGLMALALVFSTFVQGSLAVCCGILTRQQSGDNGELRLFARHILADMSGFSIVAGEEDEDDDDERDPHSESEDDDYYEELQQQKVFKGAITKFGVGVARIFSEAVLQALLQSSLIMAQDVSLVEQPLLLVSVLMSANTILTRSFDMLELVKVQWGIARESPPENCSDVIIDGLNWLLPLTIIIMIWLLLALVLTKLYMSEACESRLWGVSTGCIPTGDAA